MDDIDKRDFRGSRFKNGYFPVWQKKVIITVLNGASTGSTDININGKIEQLIISVPDLEGTGTATLDILDEDSKSWYTSPAESENADYLINSTILLAGTTTLKITTDVAQTADKNIIIYLRGE